MMIDENTSRDDLLTAIYGTDDLLDYFIDGKLIDPEFMSTEQLRKAVMDWIEAGDETAGA